LGYFEAFVEFPFFGFGESEEFFHRLFELFVHVLEHFVVVEVCVYFEQFCMALVELGRHYRFEGGDSRGGGLSGLEDEGVFVFGVGESG
jgi:hypothetical protein